MSYLGEAPPGYNTKPRSGSLTDKVAALGGALINKLSTMKLLLPRKKSNDFKKGLYDDSDNSIPQYHDRTNEYMSNLPSPTAQKAHSFSTTSDQAGDLILPKNGKLHATRSSSEPPLSNDPFLTSSDIIPDLEANYPLQGMDPAEIAEIERINKASGNKSKIPMPGLSNASDNPRFNKARKKRVKKASLNFLQREKQVSSEIEGESEASEENKTPLVKQDMNTLTFSHIANEIMNDPAGDSFDNPLFGKKGKKFKTRKKKAKTKFLTPRFDDDEPPKKTLPQEKSPPQPNEAPRKAPPQEKSPPQADDFFNPFVPEAIEQPTPKESPPAVKHFKVKKAFEPAPAPMPVAQQGFAPGEDYGSKIQEQLNMKNFSAVEQLIMADPAGTSSGNPRFNQAPRKRRVKNKTTFLKPRFDSIDESDLDKIAPPPRVGL